MKVLVIGGGGREHAVVKKLSESPKINKIYCAPGNAGISQIAQCVNIKATDIDGILKFVDENPMDMVIVTPDDPLALGLVDKLNEKKIRAFGPVAKAAELESSKAFSKNLMKKYKIPTGDFEIFDNAENALKYLKDKKYPLVIKASGLALGKGVIIVSDQEQAEKTIDQMMRNDMFGTSGHTVIIEEFLQGPEVTVLAFTDGNTIKTMPSSQDHKRALDDDKGLNTGGMGAFSPSRHYTKDIEDYCINNIFYPTIKAMKKEDRNFKGVIYFQMMLTKDGPKVIEYNARFGDPETQALLPLLKTDLYDIFNAIIDETLDKIDIIWENKASATIVLASGGYPKEYIKGFKITGIDEVQNNGITVYHMGTAIKDGNIVTNGGRVLCLTATADNVEDAVAKVYNNIEKINFKDMHFRRDIGKK
ncbi:MAG: phosphoribosylamine--glycine ligase [Clostridia bacterium]|nr:phosphoribosylamine--glycine ligase [Clostridia bacterium]MDD3971539.1 phosphoribosylamine--glycine ligase [Clostridia bacterium]MDD4542737.1 phosphoribosylamine--glycine ligase [Clostridia bacterium]HXK71909.1 phosphoribosylamine--glycine ligase [Clostridia bacterium]